MSKRIEQQLKHNDCGITAVKIVYNLHQIPVNRSFIEDNIYLTESGSSLQDIKAFFDQQQFETELNLLDLNTLKFKPEKLQSFLPCILPIRSRQGQHYVVIQHVRRKKMQVLDPATGQTFLWGWSELMNKAYTGTANYDLASSSKLLKQVIREELSAYGIEPERVESQDDADVVNKLTYFSYLQENFGFANNHAERNFLEDLLFNQQLNLLPKQFRTLKYGKDKLRVSAPVVLTVKPTEALTQPIQGGQTAVKPVSGYMRLVREMKSYHKLWGIYIGSAIFAALIGQVTIFSNQILIDNILPGYNLNLLVLFAIGLGIFRLFDLVLSLYKSYIAIHLANIFDSYFLTSFVEKLNTYSIRYIHTFSRGDLTERIKDSLKLKTFFIRFFTRILIDGFVALYSIGILFLLNWKIALIVVAILVLFIIWFKIITPYIRENEQRRFLEKSSLFSSLFENIDGLQVIKSFRMEGVFMQRLAPRIKNILNIQKRVRYVSLVNSAVINFIMILAIITIIVLLSRNAILFHSISMGQIITFIALSRQVFSSISSVLDENLDLQENEIILNRYFGFRQPDDQPRVAKAFHAPIKTFSIEQIEFRNVAFHYIPQQPVFTNLNLTINRGDKIRLEGGNGAGKSTFCKVLSLLYTPDAGDILINGEKHQFYKTSALRKKILLVSNEDMLFNDTLGYNMTFDYNSSTGDVLALAKEIGLYDFIAEKAEGLDYIVNEGGKNLSTGQRKKILLMRALLSHAELLILDETLSGIDKESKEKIEQYLNSVTDRSFIIISHEPMDGIEFTKTVKMQHGNLEQLHYQQL
ncbi:MAG: ATP-binding cassette domain-containing protein [Bacteroidota bacterium]|nr:ATP-binding cassette domain-containing protein [Bacteroidota bacterium]